jgi:hypothetical protein
MSSDSSSAQSHISGYPDDHFEKLIRALKKIPTADRLLKKHIMNLIKTEYHSVDDLCQVLKCFPLGVGVRVLSEIVEDNTVLRKMYVKQKLTDGPLEYKDVGSIITSYMKNRVVKPDEIRVLFRAIFKLLLKDSDNIVSGDNGYNEMEVELKNGLIYNIIIGDGEIIIAGNPDGAQIRDTVFRQVQNNQVIQTDVNDRPALAVRGTTAEIKKNLKKIIKQLKK